MAERQFMESSYEATPMRAITSAAIKPSQELEGFFVMLLRIGESEALCDIGLVMKNT